MNLGLTAGALLVGLSVAWGSAQAGNDQPGHDHQVTTSSNSAPSSPAPRQSETESMPALGSAEDLLKAMEIMPAHDHDSCCKLSKSQPKPNDHDH